MSKLFEYATLYSDELYMKPIHKYKSHILKTYMFDHYSDFIIKKIYDNYKVNVEIYDITYNLETFNIHEDSYIVQLIVNPIFINDYKTGTRDVDNIIVIFAISDDINDNKNSCAYTTRAFSNYLNQTFQIRYNVKKEEDFDNIKKVCDKFVELLTFIKTNIIPELTKMWINDYKIYIQSIPPIKES